MKKGRIHAALCIVFVVLLQLDMMFVYVQWYIAAVVTCILTDIILIAICVIHYTTTNIDTHLDL